MDEIKIVEGGIAYVQEHPERFLRIQPPSGAELASDITFEALANDAARVTAFQEGRWWLVGSNKDWMDVPGALDDLDLFHHVVPFPQGGVNSMRSEVLLTAFAAVVVTWTETKVLVIKGPVLADEPIWTLMRAEAWKRGVAFALE